MANSSGNSDQNNKPEQQNTSMSKRKSASNLLHFTNPFKSHHNNQHHQSQVGGQKDAPKSRESAGVLEPVLQQLSRIRDLQVQPNVIKIISDDKNDSSKPRDAHESTARGGTSNLLQVHANQLSSSHHNLFAAQQNSAINKVNKLWMRISGQVPADDSGTDMNNQEAGSSSGDQSPKGSCRSRTTHLSSSARNSVQDLHSNSLTRGIASTHAFICLDWIQLKGEPPCDVCKKPIKGQTYQQSHNPNPAYICKTCKLQVHAQCKSLAIGDCMSRLAESNQKSASEQQHSRCSEADEMSPDCEDQAKAPFKSTNSNLSRENIRLHRLAPSVKHIKRPDATKPIIEGWLKHTTLSDDVARKHYWRLDDTDITLYENDTSRRYFKAIALSKITRVISANSLPKSIKEDVLTSISSPGKAKSANSSPAKTIEFKAQMKSMFAFELSTGSMYLVQASSESEAEQWKGSLANIMSKGNQDKPATDQSQASEPADGSTDLRPPEVSSAEQQVAEDSQAAIVEKKDHSKVEEDIGAKKQNEAVNQSRAGNRTQHHHHQHHNHNPQQQSSSYRTSQSRIHQDPSRGRLYNRPRITIRLNPMSIPDHLVEGKYLIEKSRSKGSGLYEVLGSGQFGLVYAAISEIKSEDSVKGIWSGVPVAIKEISKVRFDLRQQAKLKNEANILSRLDHPGVIILERVYDLHDKIYIVMEQLEDDMLEMIMSTDDKRLSERVTKFLTYQILEALKYLHAQNIAHCDLKPENVLIVERRSQFPQIKLCDFGFARIIEENSFRCSLVGTPAYLAPEVITGERYNRSVDIWSVGVIVYVSLSGEFPFNEGESIREQISRANFMYPDQRWSKISNQAKSFINSLLMVNCERRLSASRAQMDDWIQDYQLWCDLSELEVRVGRRWVTDDADYERWTRYAREKNLQVPRSAIQLHEDLMAE